MQVKRAHGRGEGGDEGTKMADVTIARGVYLLRFVCIGAREGDAWMDAWRLGGTY